MVKAVSPAEMKERRVEMTRWVDDTLRSANSIYLYNILLAVRELIQRRERRDMDEMYEQT